MFLSPTTIEVGIDIKAKVHTFQFGSSGSIICYRINVGLSAVAYGFGDVRRGAKIWLYELSCALAFYPAFRFFAAGAQLFKRNTGTTLFLWHKYFSYCCDFAFVYIRYQKTFPGDDMLIT